jgi:Response regulator of the LytR/AlgR family
MTLALKVMIIDDERLAREEVKRALLDYNEFEVIGEANNADNAISLIEEKKPDLIFLDICMPGKSGFEILESLTIVPHVIFTTAYSEFAVQAFEKDALDYLVKPLRKERMFKTMEKVRKVFMEAGNENTIQNRRIFIQDGSKYFFLYPEKIEFVESIGNYARIRFENQSILIKRSLNHLENILGTTMFFRVNRRALINLSYIQEVKELEKGKLSVIMKAGQSFEFSFRQFVHFKNANKLN